MSPPRPALRQLATRLLEDEAGGSASTGRAVEAVFGRLRARLCAVAGARGFEALLRRAIQLARAEAPALDRLRMTPGGGLEGLAQESPEGPDALAAPACLLAHFLELLAIFVGADLAARFAEDTGRDGGPPERGAEEP